MPAAENQVTGIAVRGFKSIRTEQHLAIRPLTILAGANSSGKSSFMQPLLLLKQTLESPGDPGSLLLDGPNVRFTMAEQLLSRTRGKETNDEFSVKITLEDKQSLELVFKKVEGKGFDLACMRWSEDKKYFTAFPDMPHDDIMQILPPMWTTFYKDLGEEGFKDILLDCPQRSVFFSIRYERYGRIQETNKLCSSSVPTCK